MDTGFELLAIICLAPVVLVFAAGILGRVIRKSKQRIKQQSDGADHEV